MNRTELVTRMKQARQAFEAALSGIPDEAMTQPALPNGWSVKDVLGHVGWWARRVADGYPTLARGANPDPELEGMSTDQINARVHEQFRDRPLDKVRPYEVAAFRDLLAVAEQAPEDDLFNPYRFTATGGNTFADWIAANSYEHYADHVAELEALAAKTR